MGGEKAKVGGGVVDANGNEGKVGGAAVVYEAGDASVVGSVDCCGYWA